MKAKKAAQHRQAIATAAKMQIGGGTQNSTSGRSENNNNSDNFTVSPDLAAEDYDNAKVSKAKKQQYEEDVRLVKELDKWG